MASSGYPIADLKHSYLILDLPLSSSAHSIKQAYRRLVKRWHPDRYPTGTPAHADATQMTKLINEAYAKIHNAPLRYHIEANPQRQRGAAQAVGTSANEFGSQATDKIPDTARLEFWVRFVCGVLFGVFVGIDSFLIYLDSNAAFLLCVVALPLCLGFASARYGDKFWHIVLRRWWLWP